MADNIREQQSKESYEFPVSDDLQPLTQACNYENQSSDDPLKNNDESNGKDSRIEDTTRLHSPGSKSNEFYPCQQFEESDQVTQPKSICTSDDETSFQSAIDASFATQTSIHEGQSLNYTSNGYGCNKIETFRENEETTRDHTHIKTSPRHKEDSSANESANLSTSEDDDDDDIDNIDVEGEMLNERRNKRVALNQTRLEQLGLQTSTLLRPMNFSSRKEKQQPRMKRNRQGRSKPNGCLLYPSTKSESPDTYRDESLFTKYPGRETQIRLLQSVLEATVAQLENPKTFVPPPIFLSGPPGSGKTSIICDVVQSLLISSPRVASAYIHCGTLEPSSSIESLVESAYRQISKTLNPSLSRSHRSSIRIEKEDVSVSSTPWELPFTWDQEKEVDELEEEESRVEEMENRVEHARAILSQNLEIDDIDFGDTTKRTAKDDEAILMPQQMLQVDVQEEDLLLENHIKQSKSAPKSRTIYPRQSRLQDTDRQQKRARKDPSSPIDKYGFLSNSSSKSNHGAPLDFGLRLAALIGENGHGCAVLILDHAERLMKLAPNENSGRVRTNYLSQLLLLPKVLELRLIIIVISKNSLLMNSRIDNAAPIEKSIAILDMALHPIRIHFAAYSDDQTLRDILMTRDNLPILVGNCGNTGFQKSLVKSFVGTLIQVMRSITRDIRIILRAGVRLWNAYTEPLHPDNIQLTINQLNISGKDQQQEMLSFLGQRLIKLSRNINEVVLSVGDTIMMGSDYDDLPYLAKCMIMASYICQHNSAKKDKTLFTIHGNAKSRSRKHHGYDGKDPENDAFAVFDPNRSKALRSKGFPLERMLSIFVNVVGLHNETPVDHNDDSVKLNLSSIGNVVFLETIGLLRAAGLLRETSSGKDDVFTTAFYACDIEEEDVDILAKSIGFPLEKYLI